MNASTLLGRPGPARVLFAICFIGTASIFYTLLMMRANIFDPSGLRIFFRLLLFTDYSAAIVYLGVILVGLLPGVQRWGMRAAFAFGAHPVRVAIIATFILALCARFVYMAYPLSMDEYAAVFQSKVFASGHLAGRFPAAQLDWLIPKSFQNVFLIVSPHSGSVASAYWPGFALLLMPFEFIGLPWLCNPVLGGLTILAMHRLAMDMFADRTAAGFVILLTLASVAVTINAISFYSMSAHLLLNTLFAICVLRMRPGYCLLAGLIGSWALVLHNPFPHALFALPWIVWLAFQSDRWRLLAALFAGYLPLVLILGFGWAQFLRAIKTESLPGAALAVLDASARTAVQGAWHTAQQIFRFPTWDVLGQRALGIVKLWLWAAPALLPLAVWGAWQRRTEPRFLLIGVSALMTLLGFTLYPANQGHGWGFRYFHSAWLALPVLAAAVFWKGKRADAKDDLDLRGFVAGCAITALVVMSCLRLQQTHGIIAAQMAQLPSVDEGQQVLTFVSAAMSYYPYDLVHNDPFLRTRPVVLISHGRKHDPDFVREFYPGLSLLARDYKGSVWGTLPANE